MNEPHNPNRPDDVPPVPAADRPKDAQPASLDDIQDRLHQAEQALAVEKARRHRLTLALAATVLLALTLGGAGWLWVKADRDARRMAVTREVNEALNQATALREQARAANNGRGALLAQAREQAQRALALVENGPADAALAAQVRQLQAELDTEEKDRTLLAALEEARLAQAETLPENRFAPERAVPLFRAAFRAYGLPVGEGEPEVAAQRIRQRPAAVREAIFSTLDEWDDLAGNPRLGIPEPQRVWLWAVLEAADNDAWTRKVRLARQEADPARRQAALAALAESADVAQLPARALTRLARHLPPSRAVLLLRRAQRHYPADFWVNHDLGVALLRAEPPFLEEGVRFLTAAATVRPDSAGALLNLGNGLRDNGRIDEAIACYQKAIDLDPKFALAHNNLGHALQAKGQVDEAIACFRKAIALDPKNAPARNNLGIALANKGQLDEAIACHRQAIALDPTRAGYRYNAACAAALAAAGQGKGAGKRDARERTGLRQQALTWLRTDLALVGKQLDSGRAANRAAVQQTLKHWQQDSDLAALRDKAALDKLPAEERTACVRLWAEVAALLKKAESSSTKEPPR
jgi:tetratricopeptide (TPR) repeat protein